MLQRALESADCISLIMALLTGDSASRRLGIEGPGDGLFVPKTMVDGSTKQSTMPDFVRG